MPNLEIAVSCDIWKILKEISQAKEGTNEAYEKYDGKHDARYDERHVPRGKRGLDAQNDADDDGRYQLD
jgi:hypothetical protein